MSARTGHDELLEPGHSYDGIEEYDNPMPRWWLYIFYVSVAWGVAYWLNVIPGVGSGKGRVANYEADIAAARAKYGEPGGPSTAPGAATILAAREDRSALESGKQTFATSCALCHRADGGGNIGPNLADDYWIHGAAPDSVWLTVNNGVLDKGMPAWGQTLKPDHVTNVVAYVLTLHGTRPPDPKAPQGTLRDAQ